ncbi:MAG TPA: efflux RND transporter permease subunit [Planctomycetota bacterium]|jgi:Cu(I)/Ag(I) efflux system membrane protein CusA/SilA|nr:efflux RND transporter permease subunit [Planctomycetota bacterium]
MITRIIELCARNRLAVLLVAAAAVATGVWSLQHVALDAIPDLSDTQVIVSSRWDRSPDVIEDQVTYPIVSALLGAPRVKAVRGFSDFGFSYVYIVFQDGTDMYWARSRTLEYLSKILPRLPEGVRTELGPDATGVGWVYQYALVDTSGAHDLADLRTFQDWRLRTWLQSVPGVAEVAGFGGFQKQYQVELDPAKLLAYGIPIGRVVAAIRGGNRDVGGRLVELAGAEYMVRGRGSARSVDDIGDVVVGTDDKGTPVLVRQLGSVAIGPEIRRGVGDLDGTGDAVGGIVVIRHGENALQVIERVKARLAELAPSFPAGVELVTTYDRSHLIHESIATLKEELVAALIVVSLVVLLFLWHIPSAIVPIVTIPIAILLAFIPMALLGVSSNIMSISGITISIGVLVDGAIVEVENAYKRLERWIAGGRQGDYHAVRLAALREVGPSVFFSLLVIAVGFLPIFALEDQEGRLFKPLAYTKTLTMGIAALLAITLDPAVRMLFTRVDFVHFRPRPLAWLFNQVAVGRYVPEEQHPVSRTLFRLYEKPCRFVVRHRTATIVAAVLLVLTTVPVYRALGSEFMPPLWEGDLLHMPITLPGISVGEAQKLLRSMDAELKSFPEVDRVHGKAGRADTSTDPAPLSMMETVVHLKPQSEWRSRDRWYARWPEWTKGPLRKIWPDRITREELLAEMEERMRFPGTTYSMAGPIKTRIDMLSTGIRTPIGIKVLGDDLAKIESIAVEIESILRDVPGTQSAFAERTAGGYFLDFDLRRDRLARYGLTVDDAETVILSAIGGEGVTTTVEGRERYSVNVRYARELRDDLPALERVLVPTAGGAQIPLSELADIRLSEGPGMIRDENGLVAGYVYVTTTDSDLGGYVARAKAAVAAQLTLPAGTSLLWSGQFEHMLRVAERMKVLVPLTLFLIFMLLLMNTKSVVKAGIVLLAVPFSAIGAFWLLYALGYNMSIATWVGLIALLGLDAETGVFMLLFLDVSFWEQARAGKMRTFADLTEAIVHGAVKRIRPKLMTVSCAFIGLVPVMVSTGSGADMMKRVAAPLVGGLVTSFALELLVYPAIYATWKWRFVMKRGTVDVTTLDLPSLGGHA